MFRKKKNNTKLIESIGKGNLVKRYATLFLGCLLLAISFNLFFLPLNIVYGGVSGISIIVKELFHFNPSFVIFILSFLLLIVSYLVLGWEKTKGSIVGSILFPLCVELTANIGTIIHFQVEDVLLNIIFGAVIAGVGSGINYKSGFTTGGTDIINQIIAKYAHVSMGKAILMSDGVIVLASGFFLGGEGVIFAFEKVMYAVVVLYIISLMADKVMLGISEAKSFYIVTEHETEMKKFLIQYLEHGVTILDGRGGYTGNHQKVIMCIVPTKEYFLVKEAIHKIDENAFFVVTDAYESAGGQ
jgi:uncharacterized membrane-anchored protein YitT (DUF2179 family)